MLIAAMAVGARPEEPPSTGKDLAGLIASKLTTRKGLALDVGCGDGTLAVALAGQTDLTIECVDSDKTVAEGARRTIDAAGLYGTRISVTQDTLAPLNYPDHCASLVICGDEFVQGKRGRELKELFRVLSPRGVAWIGQSAAAAKKGQPLTRKQLEGWLEDAGIKSFEIVESQGTWACITRPRGTGWDEWTHRGHDPANTFGSEDTVAGPAFKPHWVSDYRPGLSSAAVAVANGRMALASLSYAEFPETTPYIQVLDAYSGVELWAKVGKKELPIDRPPGMYSNRENCSDIAVVGDTLYLLGGKHCHVFDLETGTKKPALAIPGEAKPDADDVWLYLCCVGDTLYGAIGKSPKVKADWDTMLYRGVSEAIFALDRVTGRPHWVHRVRTSVCSLTVGGGHFYYCDQALKLHALDARSGADVWSTRLDYQEGTEIAGCSYYRDKVWLLYNQPHGMKDRKGNDVRGADLLTAGHNKREADAYSARDGKHLFKCAFGMTIAGLSFAGGRVFGSGQHGGEGMAALDADSGAFKWKAKDSIKCTPSLGSPNCFLSQRGAYVSILDLRSFETSADLAKARRTSFTGFRPSCSYPGVPANGMVYVQAEGCACSSPIRGNIALIPGQPAPRNSENRLVKGSAFAQPVEENERRTWATWRAGIAHHGRSNEVPPAYLEQHWSKKLPGRLTPLSAGNGLIYCGSSDHKVYALDAATGDQRWQHLASNRVVVAPFLWRNRLYFSDDDGWAICVRADRGAPIWQFRAALGLERMVGYGGFMSRWPARAGVLVHDGTAYFAGGLFPDEGTAVYAVDARTGALSWEKELHPSQRGSRTAGYVPDGAMALGNNHLYIPSGVGMPWQVELDTPEHKPSTLPGYHVKGQDLMVVGKDVLAVSPGLQYVHHVHYAAGEMSRRLPVVDDESIYLLNQAVGREGSFLVAGKRDRYALNQNRSSTYEPKKDVSKDGPGAHLRWKAWKDAPMTVLIGVGDTVFSGGKDKVYATRVSDGKELWNAPVPGTVDDLAFLDGRLFVQCDSGTIVCFGAKR